MIPIPNSTYTRDLPSGTAGIIQTVGYMARIISDGSKWMNLRPLALRIIDGAPERDFKKMADMIAAWVGAHMQFRNDNFGVETLQTIPYMIKTISQHGYAMGDCDDWTILTGGLMKVVGFPVKIRVIRYALQEEFSHVVPVVFVRGYGWKEYDGTIRSGEVPAIPRAEIRDSEVIK